MDNKPKTGANNFGKWGWSMIIYCIISYYVAAALATDTLNWYPASFGALRAAEWGGGDVEASIATVSGMANMVTGIGGWLGIIAAIVFSIMAAKKGSKFMAVLGNLLCGTFCLIFAFTKSLPLFCAMIILNAFVGGNIQLNVVPNNIMNIWFPKKKGLALGWATMGLPICTATIIVIFSAIGNPTYAYVFLALVCYAVGVLSIFWVKNTPEEVGATPDNEPLDLELAKKMKE